METLPSEIKLQEIWTSLPYNGILNLCQTNTEFNKICQSNSTWEYLLYRDFGITYTADNVRNVYLLYRHALEHFTNFYSIITSQVLNLIVNMIPVSEWHQLDAAIIQYREGYNYPLILTVDQLVVVIYDIIYDEEYGLPPVYRNVVNSADPDLKLQYDDFDLMRQELNDNNCDKFKEFVSRPSLIFVNTQPILINYDYELATAFVNNIYSPASNSCEKQLEQIKNEILALLK